MKIYVFIQPLCKGQDVIQGQLNFPSPRLVAKPSLPYYLAIARGKTDKFMLFPRALAKNETQTALLRI